LCSAVLLFGSTFAQEQNSLDRNLITWIDCQTDFPMCHFTVAHQQFGDGLAPEQITVRVDGELAETLAVDSGQISMQLAFVLDAAQIVREGDQTARFTDVIDALPNWFTQNDKVELDNDYFTAYLIGETGGDALARLANWQKGNYNGFANLVSPVVRSLPIESGQVSTPLFAPLVAALDTFTNTASAKMMIVFSDGYDTFRTKTLTDTVSVAQDKNVRLYTVMLLENIGAARDEARQNLQTLAEASGGQFVDFGGDVNSIGTAVRQARESALVTFQLPKADAKTLEVAVRLPAGGPIGETITLLPIDIPALQIDSVTVNGETSDLISLAPDVTSLEIEVKLGGQANQSDSAARIQQIMYELGGKEFTPDAPPFDRYTLNLTGQNLAETPLTLIVHVVDKYDQNIDSKAIIINQLPPMLTPQPTLLTATVPLATATPTHPFMQMLTDLSSSLPSNRGWLIGVPLGLVALVLLGLTVARVRKQRREPSNTPGVPLPYDGFDTPTETTEDESDQTDVPQAPPFDPVPAAYLVAEDTTTRPERITLHVGAELRIGRNARLCDVVIDDKRISRTHAIVSHKEDGFHVQDDGGRGGTYVNRRRLTARDDRLLNEGDIIHLYAIAYRFEVADEEYTDVPDDMFANDQVVP